MQMTSTRASLVGIRDLDTEFAAITATISRDEVEEAVRSEEPAELVIEVQRPGDTNGAEQRAVSVAWARPDLERLLSETSGTEITLMFGRDELEQAVTEPDVEGHGLRERALVLTVAVAAAAAGVSSASAAVDASGGINQVAAASAVHDEAGLATRGIESAPVHDEASLAARGIESTPAAAIHDEAGLAARGIDAFATHDEASLAARGIDPQPLPAVHDEATLIGRGIVAELPAVHDEASLAARGIDPQPIPDNGGTGFDLPTVEASTVAGVAGVAGGAALLITAAAFAARRDRFRPA